MIIYQRRLFTYLYWCHDCKHRSAEYSRLSLWCAC